MALSYVPHINGWSKYTLNRLLISVDTLATATLQQRPQTAEASRTMLNQRKLKKLCKTLASVFFFHTTTKAAHTIPCLREPPPLTIGTAQSNVTVFRQCQRLSRQRVFHKVRSWIKQLQICLQKLLAKMEWWKAVGPTIYIEVANNIDPSYEKGSLAHTLPTLAQLQIFSKYVRAFLPFCLHAVGNKNLLLCRV